MPLDLLFPPSLGDLRERVRAEMLEPWFERILGEVARVRVAETYGELEESVLAMRPHIAWAPPFLAAKAQPIARVVLKAVRRGRSSYRSAFVGRTEDRLGLDTIARGGRRVAWVDPLSTGGYLLPVAHLRRQGHDPDVVFAEQTFTGSYRASLDAVLSGKADVAPIYTAEADEESVHKSLVECLDRVLERLAPFAYTDEAPNDGLLFTKRLSHEAVMRLLGEISPYAMEGPNLLLATLGAERLERASADEYAAWR